MKQLRFWLRCLFQKRKLDAEMEEEMRFHVEMATTANSALGMNLQEARYAALKKFGWVESIKERCREQRSLPWIENAVKDVRYALLSLGKSPGFTSVAVVTLALGIGMNLALFALLNDQFLRPRPVVRPAELWSICPADPFGSQCSVTVCPPYYEAIRKNKGNFDAIVGYGRIFPKLRTQVGWETVVAQLVSGDYFDFLGVQPVIGRGFLPREDDNSGVHRVVVISYRFWQNYFHGERAIIHRTLTLNDQDFEVIGVAPRSFNGFGPFLTDFWLPIGLENVLNEKSNYTLLGRLSSGISPAQAAESLTPVVREVARSIRTGGMQGSEEYGDSAAFTRVMVEREGYGSLGPEFDRDLIVGQFRLGALATVLVLLIAAMNLASLLLARGLGRRKELATRLALGATRWMVVRQLMVEGLVLATLGSVCSLLLLRWLGHRLPALISVVDYSETPLLPDVRIIAFAIASALFVGTGFSVLPAMEATRFDPIAALRDSQGCVVLPRRRWSLKKALVVVQAAGSLVLLSAAYLCVRATSRLFVSDVGFRTDRLAIATVDLEKVGYTTKTAPSAVEELRQRFSVLPGVEAVGMTDTRPFSFDRVTRLDSFKLTDGTVIEGDCCCVGPETFRTLDVPVSIGRDVEGADLLFNRHVALVNESFAKQNWPGQNPLGKQIGQFEIIGVVRDAHIIGSPLEAVSPTAYFAGDPDSAQHPTFIIRSKGNSKSLFNAIRSELAKVHPQLGDSPILTMHQAMLNRLVFQRTALEVSGAMAAVGLALTMLGAYCVMSYLVAQRKREIGIRLAVGARQSDIRRLIFRFGLDSAGAGVGFGLLAAAATACVLRRAIPGISPFDIPAYFIASAVLLLAVLLACWLPAIRAARIDPMTTLRIE